MESNSHPARGILRAAMVMIPIPLSRMLRLRQMPTVTNPHHLATGHSGLATWSPHQGPQKMLGRRQCKACGCQAVPLGRREGGCRGQEDPERGSHPRPGQQESP